MECSVDYPFCITGFCLQTDQYRRDINQFNRTAREHTNEHAKSAALPKSVAAEADREGGDSAPGIGPAPIAAAVEGHANVSSSSGEYESDSSDVSTSTSDGAGQGRSDAVPVRDRSPCFEDNGASAKRLKSSDHASLS